MSRPGIGIVLDGPTQVGRSTTIAGLQRRWPEARPGPLLEAGLDSALARFGPASGRWHELVLPHRSQTSTAELSAPVWGPLGRELLTAVHRSAAAWAAAGFDVAVDITFLDRGNVADLADAFGDAPTFHVGLVCDGDVLEERERMAGRPMGLAAAELIAGQGLLQRHITLDTSEATTDELVDEILAALSAWLRG